MSVIGFCLLMTIVFIILGIIGYRIQDNFYGIVEIIGMVIMSISIFLGATFFGLTIFTGYKNITMPVEERNFKVEYETVKQMQTSSSDLRDATYTEKLLKINQKINEAREYCNDPFWGCINSKEIANYELLDKER